MYCSYEMIKQSDLNLLKLMGFCTQFDGDRQVVRFAKPTVTFEKGSGLV